MEYIADPLKFILHNATMIGGTVFCFIVLMVFHLFKINIRVNISERLELFYSYGAVAFFIIYIIAGVIYLFYPNYLNHIEPLVASIGIVMKNGEILYPMPVGVYSYNWSLYGPALFEIQAFFQWIGATSIIVTSKLPGLFALIVSAIILLRISRNWLYRGYLLYLFPFGLMLFWNRAEPFLIMIVSISLLFGQNYVNKRYLPIIMGVLGGIASALKIHGAAYIFTAYLAVAASSCSISSILLFLVSSVLSLSAFFLPDNVLFSGFWGYLSLAGIDHGLSLKLWIENLIYLVFLSFPFVVFWRGIKLKHTMRLRITLILVIEFLITIVASKYGNGFYHLMPLIPMNAFIIQKLSEVVVVEKGLFKILYVSLIVVSFIVVPLDFVLPMAKSWHQFNYAQKEIVSLEKNFPGLMMGVTDEQSYPYAFMRVMLRKRQIDYAAFMDLQVAGFKDDEFAERLERCKIPSILIPNYGEPFSLKNYYTSEPLFSDKLREVFASKYIPIQRGKYYSVYTCAFSSRDVLP